MSRSVYKIKFFFLIFFMGTVFTCESKEDFQRILSKSFLAPKSAMPTFNNLKWSFTLEGKDYDGNISRENIDKQVREFELALLVIRDILGKMTEEEIIEKIIEPAYPERDFSGVRLKRSFSIKYHNEGAEKYVYRFTFNSEDSNEPFDFILALKTENQSKGKIEDSELAFLERLKQEGVRVPKLSYETVLSDGQRVFFEEFIPGKDTYDLDNENKITLYHKKSIVSLVYQALLATGTAPGDIHLGNFMVHDINKEVYLVDVGVVRISNPDDLLTTLLNKFYISTTNYSEIEDISYIFEGILDAYQKYGHKTRQTGIEALADMYQRMTVFIESEDDMPYYLRQLSRFIERYPLTVSHSNDPCNSAA